jgi:hypothetical protein
MRLRANKRVLASALATGLIALASAASASAAPPLFTQFPEDGTPGSGADQLAEPRGIATSPLNHHVYVAEMNRVSSAARVSQYTAWGVFVRAFGWGVKDGAAELQVCTIATGCQKGLSGSGPGQFGINPTKTEYQGPTGIAVDSKGDVYVMDLANFRVQKFDSAGNFILTFGGKVNETTDANLCTKASGDTCGAGELGTGPGEFGIENVSGVTGDYVTVGPGDTVYVGDKNRIQAFDTDGSFKSSFALPEAGNPGALDADPVSGTLYFAYNQVESKTTQPNVYRFTPSGEQILPPLTVSEPTGIAAAPSGGVYVANRPLHEKPRVSFFDSEANKLEEFGQLSGNRSMPAIAAGVVGEDANDVDVYVAESYPFEVSAIKAYGPTPDPAVVGPPPPVPPVIGEQFAASVDADGATLRAKINPRFWTDARYYVEYGTVDCETGPCSSKPAPPGSALTTEVSGEPVPVKGVVIGGLAPMTTYHYRFVAKSGGGEAFGTDRTFTTAAPQSRPAICPTNDVFRSGPGAFLPDCRAYEMVSPIDKNNSDIITLLNSEGQPAALNKSAAVGGRFTYSATRAFGDAQSSPYTTQYLTVRDPVGGWIGKSISPPRSGPTLNAFWPGLNSQFKSFSEDLCSALLLQDTVRSLAPNSIPGYMNLYREDLCGAGGYEAITQVQPPASAPNEFASEVQGSGGGHTVFRANDSLIEGVTPAGKSAKVYDYFEGGLSYVCVLPNGTMASGCSVGTAGVPTVGGNERHGQVKNAVSADGSRIFWSAATSGPGKLYLREGAAETIAVSKGPAQYWGASTDGSRAIFTEGEGLFEFEVEEDAPEAGTLIAGGVVGVVGMSDDASKVYFVSTEALEGAATAGKPNLYLHEAGGGFEFIATLSSSDVDGRFFSAAHKTAFLHAGKASPGGSALAFISDNALTGQDSLDLNSGKADSQVYLYDADTQTLHCASCNPTGARPVGRDLLPEVESEFWASGLLPVAANQLYYPRVLSDDGGRLYFNSFDALVPRDTNGAMDVYQWEAQGKGDCEKADGCVELISSGESPSDSAFVDASADGSDVFFTTNASLVVQDPGLIDIYDARSGGGFPPPPVSPAECEGEACQNPLVPPTDATPASASFAGPGNEVVAKKKAKKKHKKARAKKQRQKKKAHRGQRR